MEKFGFAFDVIPGKEAEAAEIQLEWKEKGNNDKTSNKNSTINFENPNVSSITIDAHKMLQAPYGTGVFLCRKGLIENVLTKEAQYVDGMDLTIVGSRSGANAIAVWMIMRTYGSDGWKAKVKSLLNKTTRLCNGLEETYYVLQLSWPQILMTW